MFSLNRLLAVISKEFTQLRRDRLTFGMMIGIPLMQIIIFAYAIDSDPRRLPLAVLCADNSPFSRSITASMQASDYFEDTFIIDSRKQGQAMLKNGDVQFVLTIPQDFGRKLVRGEHPVLLLEADATDPSATGGAIKAFQKIVLAALQRELTGVLGDLAPQNPPVDMRVHAQYNPEAKSEYNIVPGLMGVVMTMTLVFITSLAMTRENERGTMENLLSTPVRPLEVMLGKIIPYILIGFVQMVLILGAARFIFHVPMHGNTALIFILSIVFIAANLALGLTFSTMAKTQLQSMQMSIFFILPSIMLSGFMFPFRGMPVWAQYIGSVLPLTHYLRLVRGILLKGNGLFISLQHLWPIAVFFVVVLTIGVKRYRRTLD